MAKKPSLLDELRIQSDAVRNSPHEHADVPGFREIDAKVAKGVSRAGEGGCVSRRAEAGDRAPVRSRPGVRFRDAAPQTRFRWPHRNNPQELAGSRYVALAAPAIPTRMRVSRVTPTISKRLATNPMGHSATAVVETGQRGLAAVSPTVVGCRTHHAHCESCAMHGLCLPAGLGLDEVRRLDRVVSTRIPVRKGKSLYACGDRFTALYAIRIGTLKTVVVAPDGRQRVTGCHLGGEIVGLDGIGERRHVCDAVGLEDSEVCVFPFDQLDSLATNIPALRHNLYRAIANEVRRGQETMLWLASPHAEQRLATFLLDLADCYRARGYSGSEFVLRMTREELGSYLGLTLETVSRLFSRLQADGMIQVQGRAIKLLDLATLRRLIDHGA